jgi:hypothetical protein
MTSKSRELDQALPLITLPPAKTSALSSIGKTAILNSNFIPL